MTHDVLITVDVDWAPDWAMSRLAETLVAAGVRSTWFITHETPVLAELRRHPDLIELGIHPNFQAGSSHGSSPHAVMEECVRIVPEARTMRTHCLVQSTPILQEVVDQGQIVADTSVYLRDARGVRSSLLPLANGRALHRIPYVWEDDLEFFAPDPAWDGAEFLRRRGTEADEITIIDVHPIHFALNSATQENYLMLKQMHPDTRSVSDADAAAFVNGGIGAATFVTSLAKMRGRDHLVFDSSLSSLAR